MKEIIRKTFNRKQTTQNYSSKYQKKIKLRFKKLFVRIPTLNILKSGLYKN